MIGRFSVCVLHPQAQEIQSLYNVTVETYLQCLECTYIENGTSFLLSLPMHIRESHNSLVRVPSNLARVFSYIGILFKVLSSECYIALFDSCQREDVVCLKIQSLCLSYSVVFQEDCVRFFFKLQELRDGDKCYCEKCGEKKPFKQVSSLELKGCSIVETVVICLFTELLHFVLSYVGLQTHLPAPCLVSSPEEIP